MLCPCRKSRSVAGSNLVALDGPVVLYTGPNYTGNTQVIDKEGVYNWCSGGLPIGNDVIRSVKVQPGWKATLHLHCTATAPYGNTLLLTADTPVIQGELNANASGVTVEFVGPVVLYTGEKFTGKTQVIGKEGVYNWCKGGLPIGNDVIRSVRIAPGWKATLHLHCTATAPYGDTLVLTVSAPVIPGKLNANASGVTVEKIAKPVVVLYAGENYTGKAQEITKADVYNWCKGGLTIGNDRIRSVKVKPGWKVTLHKHCSAAGPNGPKLVLTASSPFLNCELDKHASVVTVEKLPAKFISGTFIAATRPGYPQSALTVLVDDKPVLTVLPPATFTAYKFPFPAQGAHTLKFLNDSPDNADITVFIDQIAIAGKTLKNSDFEANPIASGYQYQLPAEWSGKGLVVVVKKGDAAWGSVAGASGNYFLALQRRGTSIAQTILA